MPFSHLEGFKNAIAGKSGYIIEVVNGTKMLISYYPIKAIQTTWVVLSMCNLTMIDDDRFSLALLHKMPVSTF
jgi:hypothetical protein